MSLERIHDGQSVAYDKNGIKIESGMSVLVDNEKKVYITKDMQIVLEPFIAHSSFSIKYDHLEVTH